MFLFGVLTACDQSSKPPLVRIAINPWPGYELLFVAEKMGYFKEEGLNIKLLQVASLVDVQRTYNQGRADGFTSTIVEAITTAAIGGEKMSIVLVPDYSFGGDMIIANKSITNVSDLKGKRVGVETGSLGIVILQKALMKKGLSWKDIKYVNLEQLKMNNKLEEGVIDATVTYPPFSTEILRNSKYHSVFSTREIPKEVIDIVVVNNRVLSKDPEWVNKFHRAWFKALAYLKHNKTAAIQIMSSREGVSAEEFEMALSDLYLLKKDEVKEILKSDELKENIRSVCETLLDLKAIDTECQSINERVSIAN